MKATMCRAHEDTSRHPKEPRHSGVGKHLEEDPPQHLQITETEKEDCCKRTAC